MNGRHSAALPLRQRLLRCALALAVAALCVPVGAFASAQLAPQTRSVAASSLEDGVLTAAVYADSEGTSTVEMYFTVDEEEGTCEVGRSNTTSGSSFAISASYEGEVVIPEAVTYGGTAYTVTGIQAAAFGSTNTSNFCTLSGVSIPCTVQTVGSHAFRNCTSLVAVSFEASDDAPSQLEEIGTAAFSTCTSLEAVVLPPSLVTIGSAAFRYCTALASVEFDDIENSQLTYLGGTSSGTTQTGANAFGCTEDEPGCLQSITLPAGVLSIPAGTFAYQEQLASFEFLGTKMNFIGASAFYCCSSLVEVVIPDLAGYDGSWQFCLWEKAFTGCDSLTYIAFLGDGSTTGYKSYSQVFGETPSLQKVAYWSTEYEGNSQDQGGNTDDVSTRLFGSDVDYYFNVSFYATQEDAEAGEDEVSSVRLREDITVEELRAVLAGEAELDDEAIFTACGDEGCLPTAIEGNEELASAWWAFKEGFVDSTSFSECSYAWYDTVADDGTTDIAACRISLPTTTYTIASASVDMSGQYTLCAPDGSEVPASAYTVYAVGTFTVGEGADQTTEQVTYEDVTALSDEATYALWFEAVEGEGYTGSTWVGFTIVHTTVTMLGYPDSTKYAYTMAQALYGQSAYSAAIVVSESDPYAAVAGSWLSSVFDAPVFVLPEGEVPDRNTSNYLLAALSYVLDSGATIYAVGDTSAISAEAYEALGTASSSFSTQRLSYTGTDAPAQAWRAYSASYGTATTAYVVASSNAAYAAAATTLAYESASPVFFCEEDGTLGSYTRFVLKTSRFDEVVVVGEDATAAEAVEEQVGNLTVSYSTLTGTVQELAQQNASSYYEQHAGSTGMLALFAPATEDGGAYAVMAAACAQMTDAALYLVGSEDDVESIIPASFLAEEVAARTSTLLFVGEESFFDTAKEYLAALWTTGDEDE